MPSLALINGASEASSPIISSISCFTKSGWADAKSILFIVGIIVKSFSNARYTFVKV